MNFYLAVASSSLHPRADALWRRERGFAAGAERGQFFLPGQHRIRQQHAANKKMLAAAALMARQRTALFNDRYKY
jgi:hypothetical protein